MKVMQKCYQDIISSENLWRAWKFFRRGKNNRVEISIFERHLENNLLNLKRDLEIDTYTHGAYKSFVVHDPKRREINVPTVRDQIVHQAVWNIVFPFFNRLFSSSVFSSRPGMGTHRAVSRIMRAARSIGSDKRIFILHLDVVKFFDSIPHDILLAVITKYIKCERTVTLFANIIISYQSDKKYQTDSPNRRRGIPLGNLTSQLFCNIMLMSFDALNAELGLTKRYVRYADDCFVVSFDCDELEAVATLWQAHLAQLGLFCRWRICRFNNFEALGKRFFRYGLAIRRDTAKRAIARLEQSAFNYQDGLISDYKYNARVQSLRGLQSPAKDARWIRALRRKAAYLWV